jgi:hypothetical protein
MSLTSCPDCRNEISTNARFCPKCGRWFERPEPKLNILKHPLFLLIVSGIIITGIFRIMDNRNYQIRYKYIAANKIISGIWKTANFTNQLLITRISCIQRKNEIIKNNPKIATLNLVTDPLISKYLDTEKDIADKLIKSPSTDEFIALSELYFDKETSEQWKKIGDIITKMQEDSASIKVEEKKELPTQEKLKEIQENLIVEVNKGLEMVKKQMKSQSIF